jgi:hypothetical protein
MLQVVFIMSATGKPWENADLTNNNRGLMDL